MAWIYWAALGLLLAAPSEASTIDCQNWSSSCTRLCVKGLCGLGVGDVTVSLHRSNGSHIGSIDDRSSSCGGGTWSVAFSGLTAAQRAEIAKIKVQRVGESPTEAAVVPCGPQANETCETCPDDAFSTPALGGWQVWLVILSLAAIGVGAARRQTSARRA